MYNVAQRSRCKEVAVRGKASRVGAACLCVALMAGAAIAAEAAKGNLRYSVTVTKFDNEANWSGGWEIGDGFKTIMTDALQSSGKFIVLGDQEMREAAMAEQDFAASGRTAKGKKAPQTGRMTPAQLLVRGSVTHVQASTTGGGGGINFGGISLGGSKDTAEVNITIYLVDSETGQVKASQKMTGKAGKKGLAVGYWGSHLGGLTGNLDAFKKDNVGQACIDACGQATEFLTKQLEKIPWEGSIALAKEDKIIVNRGTREGVDVGQKFSVGKVEELVDEDTGERLDSEMKSVGTIEVTEVKEKIAYCKALTGGDKIQKGMSVVPAK